MMNLGPEAASAERKLLVHIFPTHDGGFELSAVVLTLYNFADGLLPPIVSDPHPCAPEKAGKAYAAIGIAGRMKRAITST
jgi:hypothetical protein